MNDSIIWIDDDATKLPLVWIDDDYNTNALAQKLTSRYDLKYVTNASDALKSLDALRHAALILLDMIIPVGPGPGELRFGYYTGLELLELLRNEHEITTPVIALTAVEREDVLEKLKELGVSETLVKPVLGSELLEAVNRVLGGEPRENAGR